MCKIKLKTRDLTTFFIRAINYWNKLPNNVACASSLAIFKKRLDNIIHDII